MPGTPQGAAKVKRKLLERDPDYFRKMGKLGGKAGVGSAKGFAANHERAAAAGRLGGLKSRRRKKDVQKEA